MPAQAGASRIAGVDLNKPRIRAALSAALALAPAPGGFTAAEHAARVRQIAGHDGYTTRQAAYALLTLRNHLIAPIIAGIRSPRMGRKPKIWTDADRDYEALRIGMQTLFRHVGIET